MRLVVQLLGCLLAVPSLLLLPFRPSLFARGVRTALWSTLGLAAVLLTASGCLPR